MSTGLLFFFGVAFVALLISAGYLRRIHHLGRKLFHKLHYPLLSAKAFNNFYFSIWVLAVSSLLLCIADGYAYVKYFTSWH